MLIRELTWRVYALPLRQPIITAHGAMWLREGAVLTLTTDEGIIGVGEVAPLPEFGQALAEALAALPALAALLRGATLTAALAAVRRALAAGKLPPAVCCGAEIALLDALGQAQGRPICDLLARDGASPRATVAVNALVGAAGEAAAVAGARTALAGGFGCVKLKVGTEGTPEREAERIAAVRAAIGPAMHLRLDANAGWTFDQALAVLTACADADVQFIEQPLAAGDLEGMRRLRVAVRVPIAADEALTDLATAHTVIETGAADVLVLKPQSLGGLHACQEVIHAAERRGIACVVTSALEAGIGVTAALHLAAAEPSLTLEAGLATLDLLADDLLLGGLPLKAGRMVVPREPGLGIALDDEALWRYARA